MAERLQTSLISIAELRLEIEERQRMAGLLRKSEEEVRTLNADLENRVRDRTAQLESANKELEAFSYSVSHDLRAPLGHLAGFAGLLTERGDGSLDEKTRHYVDVIDGAARQMGRLADDRFRLQPVVVLTSSREEPDLVEAYRLGVNAYVVKPVNFGEFLDAVKSSVSSGPC